MSIPYNQLAYSQSSGSSQIPAFIFETRDPTAEDYNINFKLYTGWVNTVTKAIWYLEAIIPVNGFLTSQWRSVGPIVVALVPPTTSDYQFPIGQTWIDTVAMQYWGLVNVTGTVATWENLSSGVAAGILTLTGNTGGSIAGDGARNVNIIGSGGVTVTGTPLNNTLTVSLTGGSTAVDSIGVDANTGPGTNPVLPTVAGLISVTGAQVAAATTPNVIRTDSLAANTYTIEIQRSKAEAASTVGSNGVAHFNSVDFTVDNNAFVSVIQPPATCAFDVYNAVPIPNVTGDGTNYTIQWDTVVYDLGSNFSTPQFTAPEDGLYSFTASLVATGIDAGHTSLLFYITAGNEIQWGVRLNPFNYSDAGTLAVESNSIARLTAGETAYCVLQVSGGTKTVSVYGAAISTGPSSFQGYKITNL